MSPTPCPDCDGRLAPMTLGDGTPVQTCERCNGAFFPPGALAKTLGAREDLRVAPLDDAPTAGACPACESVLMQRVPFALARTIAVARCPYCEGIFAKLTDLPAMREIPEARRPSPPRAQAALEDPDAPPFAWLSLRQTALALPVAVGAAMLLRGSGLAGVVLGGARIPLHELGHAVVAWFCGYSAVPIPFGVTWIGDARAVSMWLLLAAGLGAGAWRAARARALGWCATFAVLWVVQACCTWGASASAQRMMITFGGCAGELVFPAALLALFHARLPERLRWDQARWIALVIGAFILVDKTLDWRAARLDHDLIPWGSVMGSDGDMQRLERDHLWTPSRIAARYALLAHLCVALALAAWTASLGGAWRRRSDPAERC